jgi:hypothetical protein
MAIISENIIPTALKNEFSQIGGVCIFVKRKPDLKIARDAISNWNLKKGCNFFVESREFSSGTWYLLHLTASNLLIEITPSFNTLDISAKLGFWLEREIILSMVRSPLTYFFPNHNEFFASVRMRRNAADAARITQITFDSEAALRPLDYWTYVNNKGFILNKNKNLIDALSKTIHPEEGSTLYSFSCSRACEYVVLLALTQELEVSNPELLSDIEARWRTTPLLSSDFDNAFIREQGSFETPFPIRFYVPGDRVWFRNPDEYSTNVTGFEGSWVIYLGFGRFSNYWDFSEPTSIEQKCIEIYHWRDGVVRLSSGEYWMDEPLVAEYVKKSLANPQARDAIISQMMKLHDQSGIYKDGGFISPVRDEIRWICKLTSQISL